MQETIEDITSQKIINNFFVIMQKYNQVCQKLLDKKPSNNFIDNDLLNIYYKFIFDFLQKPEQILNYQTKFCQQQLKVISNIIARFYYNKHEEPIFDNLPKDSRFKNEIWNQDALFNYIKQSYLLLTKLSNEILLETKNLDDKTIKKLEFITNQFINAISPTNFPISNPDVIKEIFNSGGENLIKGLDNLLVDIEKNKSVITIESANKKAFTIGQNIATAKGKVVFQNDLMQLIHYEPIVKKNFSMPLLIIPPWINKFYVFDLKKENSIIIWLLEQGFNVYLISWVNPDAKLAHKNFSDYMLEGPITACEMIRKDVGKETKINAIGYCIGGTLLACTLSYMAKKKINAINSATFLTTMIDFEDVGEISIFTDDNQIEKIEKLIAEKGYLDEEILNMTFSLLRPNEMIWAFYINNYLLGKEPFPFDLLYWNSDNTRLPARMQSFYLQQLYKNNLLKKPNQLELDGVKINMEDIKVPCYFLACIDDHIVPWKSAFNSYKLLNTDSKFVLSASGHVAGVMNHPFKNKYEYRIIDNIDNYEQLTPNQGSWWLDWHEWYENKFSDKKIPAKPCHKFNLPIIEAAPGSYVMVRYKEN